MQQYKELLNELVCKQHAMFIVKASSQNFMYCAVNFPDIKKKSFFFFAELIYFIDM